MIFCPVCHGVVSPTPICRVRWLEDVVHDLLECGSCGMRFTQPWPTSEQFERFYHPGYYTFQADDQEGKGWYWAGYLTHWKSTGRFLDVGCATGHFIHGIRQFSHWSVSGVEFSPAAVEYATRTLQLDVHQGELDQAHFPMNAFDFIHINNVLEHVTEPIRLLQRCHDLLQPHGRLYLSVPHGAVDASEYPVFARQFHQPPFNHNGHLLYFSKQALAIAFRKAGFTVERAYTTNLKRGMKMRGWWPRKTGWREVYTLPARTPQDNQVPSQTTKRHRPKWYHWWRNAKGEIFRLPGVHPMGLDLVFYLRKLT